MHSIELKFNYVLLIMFRPCCVMIFVVIELFRDTAYI